VLSRRCSMPSSPRSSSRRAAIWALVRLQLEHGLDVLGHRELAEDAHLWGR
jgi:DNA-binding transcriptional regulator YbjK